MKLNRLNRYLAALLAASSVALALPAHAHRGGGMDGMHDGPRAGRMLRGLDLTQEQRDQAFKIFHEQAPALRERAQAARAARQALLKAAADPNADAGRLRQLADDLGKAQADAALLRAETFRRVVALLTPEQREKLAQRGSRHGRR